MIIPAPNTHADLPAQTKVNDPSWRPQLSIGRGYSDESGGQDMEPDGEGGEVTS